MRIFIAIRLSGDMRSGIKGSMEELKKQGCHGRFTDPDNLHLTLAFIGETARLDEIRSVARAVPFEPFMIGTKNFGRFRDILWLGVDGGEPLWAVSKKLRKALDGQGIGFDRKPFKAHITLARRVKLPDAALPEPPKLSMLVTGISVMESERIGGKLVYTEML